jgi:pilus assembly protein CpaB
MSEVLVAASDLQAGQHLDGSMVRWQSWPSNSVDASLITQKNAPDSNAAVHGTVVRAPIVAGEPITTNKIVHTDAAGVMAATVSPGMRALSMSVTTDTGAGGFILPNDRVDLLTTVQVSDTPKRYRSKVMIDNLRVLAMDQTYKEDKDQKVVLAKTATLEVTPEQAKMVMQAQATGTLSLALRSLGDSTDTAPGVPAKRAPVSSSASNEPAAIVRYGMTGVGGQ